MEEKELTGYPSIDKPWLKYYSDEAITAPLPECTMYEYLCECNQHHPDDIALIYFGKRITYGTLMENIEKTASSFAAHGIRKGDTVSVISLNTPETFYVVYALNKLGAVCCMEYVTQPSEVLVESLKTTKSKAVVVLDMFSERFRDAFLNANIKQIVVLPRADSMPFPMNFLARQKTSHRNQATALLFKQFLKCASSKTNTAVMGKNEAAIIVSTSGTTGIPKRVMLSNQNINSVVWQYQHSSLVFHRQETFLAITPPFLAFGITLTIHLPLCLGLTSYLTPDPEPKVSTQLFAKYKPNHFLGGPAHMEEMVANRKIQKSDMSHAKSIGIGGESLSIERCAEINRFLLEHHSQSPILTGYGMTELAPTAMIEMPGITRAGSVGIPFCRVNIKIVDSESGKECKYNEIGEMYVHSPSAFIGYMGEQEETGNTLVSDESGISWVKTGDLAFVDEDGFVFIKGRIKRIFLTYDCEAHQMFKMFPDYIEKLLRECDFVSQCAVIATAHKERRYAPVAFVVLSGDCMNPRSALTQYLKQCTSDYNIPYRFVFLDKLPLLPNSKVDYQTLEWEAKKEMEENL